MRPLVLAVALLGSIGIGMAGCAALEGLSSISEQACAPDCDGGASADGTAVTPGADGSPGLDVTTSADTTVPDDTSVATGEDSPTTGEDAAQSEDAPSGSDASDSSVTSDAGTADSGKDTGTPPVDSGSDTGCGPLTSTSNCSACGDTCTATNATAPTCNGTTCSYTCDSTYLDCNKTITPDLDGCECKAAPGATQSACCGTDCPVAHSYNEDITGSTFYDCVAAGTYNVTDAMDACIAFTGNAAQCTAGYYCPQFADGGGDLGDQVCSDGSPTKCDCWAYDGSLIGLVSTAGTGAGPTNCYCPAVGTSPHWD
jgi:hypothetical protein